MNLSALNVLGNVEFIKYSFDVTERILNSSADYIIVTDIKPDFDIIKDLDSQILLKSTIIEAQFVEFRFTAFTRLIFCGFESASEYAKANLRKIY